MAKQEDVNVAIFQEAVTLKKASVKALLLLFLNTTIWLAGSFLFIYLEGSTEKEHKCGVKRVQRDFVDDMWKESRSLDEGQWKSSARKRLVLFEEQLHQAVEAGISTYSGQKVWSPDNAFVYCFTLATTIGYGHLTPSSPTVRLVSIVYGMVACPLLAALLVQVSCLLSSIINITLMNYKKEGISGVSPALLGCTLVGFSFFGAIFFSVSFSWSLQESVYFVLSTLSTIGFGDVVPQDSLIFLLLGGYILIGLSLYSLWQESILVFIDESIETFNMKMLKKKECVEIIKEKEQ